MLYQNDLVFAAIFVPKNSAGKGNFMAWNCSEANQCVMSKVILQEPFLEKKSSFFMGGKIFSCDSDQSMLANFETKKSASFLMTYLR